jgi:predicted outer membrane repeat protein
MNRTHFLPVVVVVFLMVSAASARASAEWTVCESGCDFASIQAGIDGANPGDTLLLLSELYDENVVVHKNVNIHGRGWSLTIVSGGERGIVFMIEPGVRTVISNVDLVEGSAPNGAAVYNNGGTVILSKVSVGSNQTSAAWGTGAIYNDHGQLTILDSIVQTKVGNIVSNYYGQLVITRSSVFGYRGGGTEPDSAFGVYNYEGAVTVSYDYVSGNSGAIYNHVNESSKALTIQNSFFWNNRFSYGGAIYSAGRGQVKIYNSTFTGNEATSQGGAVYAFGAVTVANSTFVGNQAPFGAAIVTTNLRNFRMDNTIVTGSVGGPNCGIPYSLVVQGGHNLIDDGSCGFPANPVTNLDELGLHNGGPTPTFGLLPGSNAIDSGDNAVCSAKGVGGVDQRGFPRSDGACDIGAFELQQ